MIKGGIALLCTIVVLCLIQGEAEAVDIPADVSFTLSPKMWPEWHLVMGSDLNGVLHGDKHGVGLEGQFQFELVNANEPYFYMKSAKWSNKYVYMSDTVVQSTSTKPGDGGKWKITKTSDGMITFSPKKWPDWYMCMKNDYIGTVKGCQNTPGDGGIFYMKVVP